MLLFAIDEPIRYYITQETLLLVLLYSKRLHFAMQIGWAFFRYRSKLLFYWHWLIMFSLPRIVTFLSFTASRNAPQASKLLCRSDPNAVLTVVAQSGH